jgi:microcompartment protein CcmK/EutM
MFLGRVRGHIVTTAKDPSMAGRKLLVVEPLKVDYDDPAAAANGNATAGAGAGAFGPTGRAIVAMDTLGAGDGQLVLVTQGSSARLAEGCNKTPTDAVVVGIVDEAVVMGRRIE